MFDGDRSKTCKFLLSWNLWAAINANNNTMKKPFSGIVTMLSYMDGTCVDAWKEEQLDKMKEEADKGIQETDEILWDNFIERFKNAFENQNRRSEAYQELCKLKQGESLDDFFAKFKQLAHEAGVPLDDKGTIETLKHAIVVNSLLLWVARLDDGAELKVTDPKEQQGDVEEEEAKGEERRDGVYGGQRRAKCC